MKRVARLEVLTDRSGAQLLATLVLVGGAPAAAAAAAAVAADSTFST